MNFNLGNDLEKARGVSSEMLDVFLKSNYLLILDQSLKGLPRSILVECFVDCSSE